jgi:hypothetical protein
MSERDGSKKTLQSQADEDGVPSLATFYLPEEAVKANEDSVLVGFNFSGFCFVVMKCIPRSEFKTFDQLQALVSANK